MCLPTKDVILERKRRLDEFFERTLLEARLDSSDCKFSDIPVQDNSEQFTYLLYRETGRKAKEGKAIEERQIKINLIKCLFHRTICRILDSPQYNYWHESTKNEMSRLRKYVTKIQLRMYLCNFYHNYDKKGIADYMNKNSTLGKLLLEREKHTINSETRCLINKKILTEWYRVLELDIPAFDIMCFASEILHTGHIGNSAKPNS